MKQVLVGRTQNYVKDLGFERVKMLLGNGIIVSGGEYWRSQRRMIQPAFHRQVIARLSETMRDLNRALLRRWETKANTGEKLNITNETSELALETVLRAIFSEDLDAMTARFGSNPFAILSEDAVRNLRLAFKFRALTGQVKDVVARRHEENRRPFGILSMLIAACDGNGALMSDKAVIDEVMP